MDEAIQIDVSGEYYCLGIGLAVHRCRIHAVVGCICMIATITTVNDFISSAELGDARHCIGAATNLGIFTGNKFVRLYIARFGCRVYDTILHTIFSPFAPEIRVRNEQGIEWNTQKFAKLLLSHWCWRFAWCMASMSARNSINVVGKMRWWKMNR